MKVEINIPVHLAEGIIGLPLPCGTVAEPSNQEKAWNLRQWANELTWQPPSKA